MFPTAAPGLSWTTGLSWLTVCPVSCAAMADPHSRWRAALCPHTGPQRRPWGTLHRLLAMTVPPSRTPGSIQPDCPVPNLLPTWAPTKPQCFLETIKTTQAGERPQLATRLK